MKSGKSPKDRVSEVTPKVIEKTKKVVELAKKPAKIHRLWFSWYAVSLLFITTIIWAAMGAIQQHSNADQLVNSYLFEDVGTFRHALLPSAHTFLLKWPLFLMIKLFGSGPLLMGVMTVVLCLITLALFVRILHRIEPRPFIFGSLILALTSILLLVPAQPYPGGILPVNMAMLATRNIEYVVFIFALLFQARSSYISSKNFWISTGLLSLLIASDKLFFGLTIVGGLVGLVFSIIIRRKTYTELFFKWLMSGSIAYVIANITIWLIKKSTLTSIAAGATDSPYALVHGVKDMFFAGFYAIFGIFTNFGANPAFDSSTIRSIPAHAFERLLSLPGPIFVINALFMVIGIFLSISLVTKSAGRDRESKPSVPNKLSLMLLSSSIAAIFVFISTKHYFFVDARYLTIVLFAVFVASATYLRKIAEPSVFFAKAFALIMTIVIILGLFGLDRTYRNQRTGLDEINYRNTSISKVLESHPVTVLVGDYWRVVPLKQHSQGDLQKIMPLGDCTNPRGVLSSTNWQYDLENNSFAYVLSLDKSLSDFPSCSLEKIVEKYGRPNSSTLIAGTYNEPKELLLFYDSGAHKSAPITPSAPASTVLPISLSQLPHRSCTGGKTIMNVVAHEDDDLLFINPDLQHAIDAHDCVRTIYLTAGDAGAGQLYWSSRERGSEAAYSSMLGFENIWVKRIVQISEKSFVVVTNPSGNYRISIIYVRLPDGNLKGQGFGGSNNESLDKLLGGSIPLLHSVDNQSEFDLAGLSSTLASLFNEYLPAEIRTQAPYNLNGVYPDHSDHLSSGKLTDMAFSQYQNSQNTQLVFYAGYPIRDLSENVEGNDLERKARAFFTYAKFDSSVCGSMESCANTPTYGSYLKRQYVAPR